PRGTKARGDEIRKFFPNTDPITKNHRSKASASPTKQGDGSTNVFNAVNFARSQWPSGYQASRKDCQGHDQCDGMCYVMCIAVCHGAKGRCQ
ncbi:hypothetical protein BG011_001426, partial [Mortierella polycephala]